MRTLIFAFALIALLIEASIVCAQSASQSFPYDAVILDDEVYARSGPGRQYYPTSRFRKGDRVTIVRHDPGGWFMIDPPPGSFAWVRQEFVKRDGEHGIINSDTAVVAWIGSTLGNNVRNVEQRRLQKGEEVEVLGAEMLRDERGDIPYLKIKSPRGHYRWIPGAKAIAADRQLAATQAKQRGTDPFTSSGNSNAHARDPNVSPIDPSELAASSDTASEATKHSVVPQPKDVAKRGAPTPQELNDQPIANKASSQPMEFDSTSPFQNASEQRGQATPDWQRLTELDREFQDMIKRDTRDWHFATMERELRELQTHPETDLAAGRRLSLLDKYKQIKLDYDQFQNIIDETTRRDAELAAKQKQNASNSNATGNAAAPLTQPTTRPATTARGNVPIPNSTTPQKLPNRFSSPSTQSPTATTPQPATPNRGKFSGAGIIQRSSNTQPGAPRHVLVHPSGRVLAYLESDGINLDKYIGESMGLEGERYYRPDLRADYLKVRAMSPVKLKP